MINSIEEQIGESELQYDMKLHKEGLLPVLFNANSEQKFFIFNTIHQIKFQAYALDAVIIYVN